MVTRPADCWTNMWVRGLLALMEEQVLVLGAVDQIGEAGVW